MAPAAKRTRRGTETTANARRPLAVAKESSDQNQVLPNLVEIFNNSQHPAKADTALSQLKKLYKNTEYSKFERPFLDLLKKLLQSKHGSYFKSTCECLFKFLEHVSKMSDEIKVKSDDQPKMLENTAPPARARRSLGSVSNSSAVPVERPRTSRRPARKATKRKADLSDEDELIADFTMKSSNTTHMDSTDDDSLLETTVVPKRTSITSSTMIHAVITNHDRLITACMDVVDRYMYLADEDSRFNAVYFVYKFLPHVNNLDEEICIALKSTLPQRIRDKKPIIRAHAVYASRTFQDHKLTQDAFKHHFYRDPELMVRKALLQIMDTKVFGYQFLVDSTQDAHASMRKDAFRRLGKLAPSELDKNQLHQVLRNGLNERELSAGYFFRTNTLDHWLKALYDGTDLHKLLGTFDTINNHQDICKLLELIFQNDLLQLENNGTTTKLHLNVEAFRERWLEASNTLPQLETLDANLVTVWLTMINFCKKNQTHIKSIKIRTLETQHDSNDNSIEKILDSQLKEDETVDLFERLTPDLVNIVGLIPKYVSHVDKLLKSSNREPVEYEFVYQQLMAYICSYDIGDELECKTIHEVLSALLRENLLTDRFDNYVLPIIKCLSNLIYPTNHTLFINYVSEIINNVRSHLEDILTTKNTPIPTRMIPLGTKRDKRVSIDPSVDRDQLELKIANLRVEIEDLKDSYDEHLKNKDFDAAKATDAKLNNLKTELATLHARRCSIASDISVMDMVVEEEPTGEGKLCSTMIEGDVSMNESDLSTSEKEDVKVFKHHPNELLKCLQMYYGCLQSVNVPGVPPTMRNHLRHLIYECLDDYYQDNARVRSLMTACNGITALIDSDFANEKTTVELMMGACFDNCSIETRTVGFKTLVDVICQHENINFPYSKVEFLLNRSLRDYGKSIQAETNKREFDHQTAVIEGTAKLFYFRKFSSASVLSHLILWWYHPNTHSKLKQFIGIFLPSFVEDIRKRIDPNLTEDVTWLKDLLEQTFVTSIEYLHTYILSPTGSAGMSAGDLVNLINFLSNLIPVSFHSGIAEKVDERIDELSSKNPDLVKYLKQSKNSLSIKTKPHVPPGDLDSPSDCQTPPQEVSA